MILLLRIEGLVLLHLLLLKQNLKKVLLRQNVIPRLLRTMLACIDIGSIRVGHRTFSLLVARPDAVHWYLGRAVALDQSICHCHACIVVLASVAYLPCIARLLECLNTILAVHARSTVVVREADSSELCGLLIHRLQVERIVELCRRRAGHLGCLGEAVRHTTRIPHHRFAPNAHSAG